MFVFNSNLSLFLFVFTLGLACNACKTDVNNADDQKTKENIAEAKALEEVKIFDPTVPDACTLLTTQEIASVIGIDASVIGIKDGSNVSANTKARSCFFRWEHDGLPNNGVLVQAQANPVPEEFPDWATTIIGSKIKNGEKSFGTGADDEQFMYKSFEGVGIEGAYNFIQSKYFWRVDDQIIYMVSFNLPGTEEVHVEWAKKIAKFVTN